MDETLIVTDVSGPRHIESGAGKIEYRSRQRAARPAPVGGTALIPSNHTQHAPRAHPRAIIGGNVPAEYTVAAYIADLRAIRNTGSATAETSFYPPLDRLLNAAGATLKPPVLFSTQLRDQGAGLPDGGFFPKPRRSPATPSPRPFKIRSAASSR